MLKPFSTPSGLAFWSANLLVVSMVVSPFLLSISMWGLVFAAWWQVSERLSKQKGLRSTGTYLRSARAWWEVLRDSFGQLFQRRELAALTCLLLAPVLSFFWSADTAYWLRWVQISLPFLVLPWAFANLPTLSDRHWKIVLYLFFWFMVGLCICIGLNFYLHYEVILEGLGRGNPIPVPRSHVRFSMILATAIVSGAWLWQSGFWLKKRWERPILAISVLFLFVFIHVLSVRGGLLALYCALLFGMLWYVWKQQKWGQGIVMLGLLMGFIWVAVRYVPSLNKRMAYMKYDWERFIQNDGGESYSDAGRWVSLQVGWQVWRESPLLGAGAGDLRSEMERVTAEMYPSYSKDAHLPHNQFVFILASTGLVGLALSLYALGQILYAGRHHWLFLMLQIMAYASFLIECTIQNAIGVAWFLFYSLWFLQKDPSPSTFSQPPQHF